ncbi:MAG: glycosyltransferase family 4 protein, partial [Patescibacteria group bacterium]|nr:glycosyltransferase family 4 protein [Patescibacteria group bacterium]
MHEATTYKKPTLLFVVTEDWYFCSHRLPIACSARDAGFKVIVATRVQCHGEQILKEGFKLIPIRLRRSNKNPLKELLSLIELINIYRLERPDIVHHVAMKPVLYGSVAALVTRVPGIINALAGMGYMFISNHWKAVLLRKFVSQTFRILLNRPNMRIILQNPDDQHLMARLGALKPKDIVLIRGSGVNIQIFSPVPELAGILTVVLPSRMLWDKGVGEFVEAACLLRNKGLDARFVLVGDTDTENPAAVTSTQLDAWNSGGIVEWWGMRDYMPTVFAQAHVICLPSYREGLPKVLIEAAACG